MQGFLLTLILKRSFVAAKMQYFIITVYILNIIFNLSGPSSTTTKIYKYMYSVYIIKIEASSVNVLCKHLPFNSV